MSQIAVAQMRSKLEFSYVSLNGDAD